MIEAVQSGGPGATAVKSATPATGQSILKAQTAESTPKLQDFAQNLRASLGPQIGGDKEAATPAMSAKDKATPAVAAKDKAAPPRKSDASAGRVNKRKGDAAGESSRPQPAADATPDAEAAPPPVPAVATQPTPAEVQIAPAYQAVLLPPAAPAGPGAEALAIEPATTKMKAAEKARTSAGPQPAPASIVPGPVPSAAEGKALKAEPLPMHELRAATSAAVSTLSGKLETVAMQPQAGTLPGAHIPRAVSTASLPATVAAPAAAPETHTFVASANVLEIGLSAGSHGWLRVRAEMDGAGEVTAQVTAGSAAAAEHLGKEIPAIQAYLATEQVGLSALVVNASEASAGAYNAAAGGAGPGSQTEQERPGSPLPGFAPEDAKVGEGEHTLEFGSAGLPAALLGAGASGGWLSVRV